MVFIFTLACVLLSIVFFFVGFFMLFKLDQRQVGAQVAQNGSFTKKGWPMSANAPPCPSLPQSDNAPVPFYFSSYHAGRGTCHLPRWWAAWVPNAHLWCQWRRASPKSVKDAPFGSNAWVNKTYKADFTAINIHLYTTKKSTKPTRIQGQSSNNHK